VLVELDGASFLTDPLLRARILHLWRVAPTARPTLDVDAVLISHVHWDHLDLRSLELLPRRVPIVVPRGAGRLLRRRGFASVVELDQGERLTINGAVVRATEADHPVTSWARRAPAPALGFVLEGARSVYFAGDTDLFDGMAALAPRLDLALLPVAGWGPTLPPGHLDPERAAHALALLRPAIAVPIHWGTYAPIGMRKAGGSAAAPTEFRRHAAKLAPGVDVRILDVGGSTELG
jgi:L-ascorbate metabolism protein UlaG (beta-lactamase superfamily)